MIMIVAWIGAIWDVMPSSLCVVNCLQDTCSHGQGAVMCKSVVTLFFLFFFFRKVKKKKKMKAAIVCPLSLWLSVCLSNAVVNDLTPLPHVCRLRLCYWWFSSLPWSTSSLAPACPPQTTKEPMATQASVVSSIVARRLKTKTFHLKISHCFCLLLFAFIHRHLSYIQVMKKKKKKRKKGMYRELLKITWTSFSSLWNETVTAKRNSGLTLDQ